ncbi:hypothetical protein PC116_g27912 [Phytophthora cactorum]|nr:hypothetical protein PC116_g27912 [Phytophthora cactorum]
MARWLSFFAEYDFRVERRGRRIVTSAGLCCEDNRRQLDWRRARECSVVVVDRRREGRVCE